MEKRTQHLLCPEMAMQVNVISKLKPYRAMFWPCQPSISMLTVSEIEQSPQDFMT